MTTHAAVSLEVARRLWLDAQRLSAPAASAAEAVRSSGWWHSAGGATVPLAMAARGVAIADAVAVEVDHEELFEVPGVRRSMFLVPREDAGVALAASVRSTRDLIAGAWRAAGGTARDAATLKNAILEELAEVPL
ncbi:MAG TPA: hypothetical protein VMH39_00310, partial [Gemmatimonadaceae bacterium]|nr:hypothetical protein [Gemmatimonadaceae bacterium]